MVSSSRWSFRAADVNGDRLDDVVAISQGPDNSPAIHYFRSTSTTSTSLADPTFLVHPPAPAWNMNHLKWAGGDFNGDGRDDLFAASGGAGNPVAMYIFRNTGTTLANPVLVKLPNPQAWIWERLQF